MIHHFGTEREQVSGQKVQESCVTARNTVISFGLLPPGDQAQIVERMKREVAELRLEDYLDGLSAGAEWLKIINIEDMANQVYIERDVSDRQDDLEHFFLENFGDSSCFLLKIFESKRERFLNEDNYFTGSAKAWFIGLDDSICEFWEFWGIEIYENLDLSAARDAASRWLKHKNVDRPWREDC